MIFKDNAAAVWLKTGGGLGVLELLQFGGYYLPSTSPMEINMVIQSKTPKPSLMLRPIDPPLAERSGGSLVRVVRPEPSRRQVLEDRLGPAPEPDTADIALRLQQAGPAAEHTTTSTRSAIAWVAISLGESPNTQLICTRARSVMEDGGLSIWRTGDQEDGLFTSDLEQGVAIVLSAPGAIGLAHSSAHDTELRDQINQYRNTFVQEARLASPTAVTMTLCLDSDNYFLDIERDLDELAAAGGASLADNLRTRGVVLDLPATATATVDEHTHAAASQLTTIRTNEVRNLAHIWGANFLPLKFGAVFVASNGDINPFDDVVTTEPVDLVRQPVKLPRTEVWRSDPALAVPDAGFQAFALMDSARSKDDKGIRATAPLLAHAAGPSARQGGPVAVWIHGREVCHNAYLTDPSDATADALPPLLKAGQSDRALVSTSSDRGVVICLTAPGTAAVMLHIQDTDQVEAAVKKLSEYFRRETRNLVVSARGESPTPHVAIVYDLSRLKTSLKDRFAQMKLLGEVDGRSPADILADFITRETRSSRGSKPEIEKVLQALPSNATPMLKAEIVISLMVDRTAASVEQQAARVSAQTVKRSEGHALMLDITGELTLMAPGTYTLR